MIIYTVIILLDIVLVHIMYGISGYIIDYVYFITSIFWLITLAKKDRRLRLLHVYRSHPRLNRAVIAFSVVLIVFALITKTGYHYSWGASFFTGFSGLTHTAASSMCLICAMVLLSYIDKPFNWMIFGALLIFCFGIFETGARTYLVPAVLIIYLYVRNCSGNKKFKFVLYAFALVLVIIVLTKSSIVDKFFFTSNVNIYNPVDSLTQQTSGRSTFWLIDLKGFAEGSLFAKLFGHGHGYTYYLNKTYYGLEVWAHNDFIQLLVGGGIVSLGIYLFSIRRCFRGVLIGFRFVDKCVFFMYWFFVAFFNGFYNYAHYFLSFVLVCLLYDQIMERQKRSE